MSIMKSIQRPLLLVSLLLVLVISGCATNKPSTPKPLPQEMPRSIVVIPPLNNTSEVNAPYVFLSAISKPLADKGYYVFPVAVIDKLFKENGLPTTAEMNNVPLPKIKEIIGADAVLYTNIQRWGQHYQVVNSKAVVHFKLRLVDASTGKMIWQGSGHAEENTGHGGNDLKDALIAAVIDQIVSSLSDKTKDLAHRAVNDAVNGYGNQLPKGYYRIQYQEQNVKPF
ncbi:MAG: DUF799 domain-containing protein [Pseudomonadales bacterium]|nr:DUF799 domain-containing protein [Pseudomonadales bacterium]